MPKVMANSNNAKYKFVVGTVYAKAMKRIVWFLFKKILGTTFAP